MCTVLYVPWDRGPVAAAIGLNRDEAYARPAAAERWWPAADGGVGFVAPVDLRAGGTWYGLAETGLFVALTNGRHGRQPAGPFRGERSRGELVVAALRRGGLAAAVDDLAARDAFAYNPCHLLLAQGDQVAYVAPDSHGRFAVAPLERAAHSVTNAGLDAGDTPALPVGPGGAGSAAALAALRAALATHAGATARCRHGRDYGTRSSAVVLLGPDLPASRVFTAAGRPCDTPFRELALAELTGAASDGGRCAPAHGEARRSSAEQAGPLWPPGRVLLGGGDPRLSS